jgi:hypothetical protein
MLPLAEDQASPTGPYNNSRSPKEVLIAQIASGSKSA